jgi:hypothetical protein
LGFEVEQRGREEDAELVFLGAGLPCNEVEVWVPLVTEGSVDLVEELSSVILSSRLQSSIEVMSTIVL